MQFPRFFRLMPRGLAAVALVFLLASSPALRAQDPAQDSHLVSPSQLQQQVENATTARQKNVTNLTQFLSTPAAEKAMKDARIDPVQVRTAIPTLSDAELANLSARASHAQQDFAAGHLGPTAWVLIIIIIAVVIVVAAIH